MKKLLPLLLLFLAGCTSFTSLIPAAENPRAPTALSQEVIALVKGPHLIPFETNTFFTKEHLEDDSSYNAYRCSVNSTLDNPLAFKYLHSKIDPDKKHPIIFIYNILKDKDETVSHFLAGALADNGYDCIIVQQENFLGYGWARPVLQDILSPRLSFDDYNASLARNIYRIITSWIPQQIELDGRYGFIGVSLGGIHAIAAAALFPKAVLTVAIMAGGDNLDLFKESLENLVVNTRERLLKRYALQAAKKHPDDRLRHQWRAQDRRRIDYQKKLYDDIASLKFTVLKLAKGIKTNKIKLMITLNDTSVPTSAQWRLYHALGGPEARLFPCGHHTMVLYYCTISDQLVEWMNKAFAEGE